MKIIRELKLFFIPIIILCFDQWSKYWIKTNYELHIPTNILGDYLRITYCENPGIAFGIKVGPFHSLITLISIFIAFSIIYYIYIERNNHITLIIGLGLILGGALGNIVDRIYMYFDPLNYRGVVDFIDIGLSNNLRWYVFNVADSAVTCGIILYLIYAYCFEKEYKSV